MSSAIIYTNGFRVADVLPALMNRTRWRQPSRADFPFTLSAENVWPAGDEYSPVFESVHKIITPYNIWQTQEDTDIDASGFNGYLQNFQKDAVIKSLCQVFDTNEHLERKLMFERFGRQDYVNENTGLFVCVRITPAQRFDVSVQIDNVALKFDTDVTFPLYLFHDTQPKVPLWSVSVTAKANEQKIVDIKKIISYAGFGNKSGVYYLGYFQSDLTGGARAINEIIKGFNPMNYFGCVPVELKSPAAQQIDVNQVSFTIKTHGFNVQLSAFRDFTQNIVDNNYLFDNLIRLNVGADAIELFQNTTRTNKDQRIMGELTKQLYTDLNQANPTEEIAFVPGLKARIQKEAARVKRQFYAKEKVVSITHDTQDTNIYGTAAPMLDAFKY